MISQSKIRKNNPDIHNPIKHIKYPSIRSFYPIQRVILYRQDSNYFFIEYLSYFFKQLFLKANQSFYRTSLQRQNSSYLSFLNKMTVQKDRASFYFFRISMYSYMLADQKEEKSTFCEQIFQLRAIESHHLDLSVTCDFTPIECRKTYKVIRTLPTYHPNLDQPFQSEASMQVRSMGYLPSAAQQKIGPILMPKPTTHFCQVCKEGYDDYLKHVRHPLHQRRMKESEKSFSIESLQEILETKRAKAKKLTWHRQVSQGSDIEERSLASLDQTQIRSFGSKKRIVLRDGQLEPVSVTSSTQCEEENFPIRPQRKQARKLSNFCVLPIH